MRVLKYILFIVLGVVLLLLLVALFVPRDMNLVKQITINRNSDSVFEYVKLLKNQEKYSVWYRDGLEVLPTYQGTDGTEGFEQTWKGKHVGAGTQTITSIIDQSRMESTLLFKKPFKSKADSYMLVEPDGAESCKLSWGFTSHTPYPLNILVPLLGIKARVSKDYEQGLKNLKGILEHQ